MKIDIDCPHCKYPTEIHIGSGNSGNKIDFYKCKCNNYVFVRANESGYEVGVIKWVKREIKLDY